MSGGAGPARKRRLGVGVRLGVRQTRQAHLRWPWPRRGAGHDVRPPAASPAASNSSASMPATRQRVMHDAHDARCATRCWRRCRFAEPRARMRRRAPNGPPGIPPIPPPYQAPCLLFHAVGKARKAWIIDRRAPPPGPHVAQRGRGTSRGLPPSLRGTVILQSAGTLAPASMVTWPRLHPANPSWPRM